MKIKLIETGQEVSVVNGIRLTMSLSSIFDKASVICPATDALRVNSRVEITDDNGNPLVYGFVGSLSPSNAKELVVYTIVSYSNLIMNGCPIVSTGEFIKSTNVDIISAIVEPYGLQVFTGDKGVVLEKYNVNLDMPVSQIVNNLCSITGLVPTASADGLYLYKANPNVGATVDVALHDLNSKFIFIASNEAVCSEYEVVGEGSFSSEVDATQYSHSVGGMLPFTKKLRLSYDGLATIGLCQKKAEQIADLHNGSYEYLTATLTGMYDTIGKGDVLNVQSDKCKIHGLRMVETIEFVVNKDGSSNTIVTLCYPSKYGGIDTTMSGWIK